MVDKMEKYSIVVAELKRIFQSLPDYEMIKTGIEIDFPERERFITVFSNSKVKIIFSYTERNIRDEVFDNFNISISRDEYIGFEFETYLKSIGIINTEEKMKLINYEGDFKARIEKFCEFINDIFSNQLRKVLSGEEWINIGFDWGPYK